MTAHSTSRIVLSAKRIDDKENSKAEKLCRRPRGAGVSNWDTLCLEAMLHNEDENEILNKQTRIMHLTAVKKKTEKNTRVNHPLSHLVLESCYLNIDRLCPVNN